MTGEDGTVTFDELEYGKYIVKELEAPVGFLMKETAFEAEITEDGKIVEITVQNSREPVIPYIPSTGDNSTPLTVFIMLILFAAATVVMIRFRASGKSILDEIRRLINGRFMNV